MRENKLEGIVVPRDSLDAPTIDRLYALFSRHYEHVDPAEFHRDLAEKQWIILLRDTGPGEIRGFSTLLLMDVPDASVPARAIFSGDTIIDPAYWGEQALVRCWCQFMGQLLVRFPESRLYWFLLSKGYRTYLFLPIYFHRFYPGPGEPTPPEEQRILERLASTKYPRDFNPRSGLIEFASSHGQLTRSLARISPRRMSDPNVRFFLERNPRYAEGWELVCVAWIAPSNMKGLARRMLLEGMEQERAASGTSTRSG